MKKASTLRANMIILIEAVVWIFITLFIRTQMDLAATRLQLAQVWVFLLKIVVVGALIAIALALHGRIFRWLVRRGVLPAERQE
jgi:hypothetical protein